MLFLSNFETLEIESICGDNIPEFELPNLKKLIFTSCPNTRWLKNLTELEMVTYTMAGCCTKDRMLVWPHTLKLLKIVYEDYRDCALIPQSLINLFQLIDLELPFLSNLVTLEIESICGDNIPEFELPNLKKLIFTSCSNTRWLKNLTELEMVTYTMAVSMENS
ncbi:unnamed protein product [Rotaria sordida]|uniref:Uncharacterized protein n=1 Tax=Rotaria sordida TaxID=392033 RepID=A0A814SHL3_9BILA|nr:unnamed protein product [Rotaria sordida]